MRWSMASVSSTGDNIRRSTCDAASLMVRVSMSVPVMSNLLSLREPRDRHDHPVSSVRHLATQVVGGGHQAREHRHEPGSPLGRQRQICQGAQPVDRLPGNGVLWIHDLLFSVGGPTSASGVTRDATDLIEGPTGSLLRVRFHRIRYPHGWAQQRHPPPTVPHRPAPRYAWAPPPHGTPHAASAPRDTGDLYAVRPHIAGRSVTSSRAVRPKPISDFARQNPSCISRKRATLSSYKLRARGWSPR